jgi:hypothetical protein
MEPVKNGDAEPFADVHGQPVADLDESACNGDLNSDSHRHTVTDADPHPDRNPDPYPYAVTDADPYHDRNADT